MAYCQRLFIPQKMASKAKQDILRFPVRKTRSELKSKEYLPKNSIITPQNGCFSPNKITCGCKKEKQNVTPRKKKLVYNDIDQENEGSPNKQKCVTNIDQNLSYLSKFPIVCLERTPLKSVYSTPEKRPELSATEFSDSPKFCRNLNFDGEIKRSPKIQLENPILLPQTTSFSPQTPRNTIGLYRAELKPYHSLKSILAQNFNNQIVGRETEINSLKEFFSKHLKNGIPGSLYISGAPGTGKTASVNQIIDDLSNLRFKKVFLNCMSKKSSKEIFTSISDGLNLKPHSIKADLIHQIEKVLTSSKIPILIILDEIDQLESKDQEVLYTLFEWPSLAKSKLVLVGIANMLDLTDRILPRLEASRACQPQLLHFPPYSKKEIIDIINERIKEADLGETIVIKPSAIHFLAAKVSSVAGDARKALDVCRRAVELCELQTSKQLRLNNIQSPRKSPRKFPASLLKQVDITLVLSIFNEVYGNRVTTEITENHISLPLQQKILIVTLLLILKESKIKYVNLGMFHEVYSRICLRQKLARVEQSEFFSLCTLLDSRGILHVKKSKELRNSKISLRLDEQETQAALGDKVLLATILQDKVSLRQSSRKTF